MWDPRAPARSVACSLSKRVRDRFRREMTLNFSFSSQGIDMSGLRPLIGRRHFLASTLVGTIGLCLPATAAQAAAGPPTTPGAETLSQTPTLSPATAAGESSLIGAAATAQPSGDASIRPFKYHASDAEL